MYCAFLWWWWRCWRCVRTSPLKGLIFQKWGNCWLLSSVPEAYPDLFHPFHTTPYTVHTSDDGSHDGEVWEEIHSRVSFFKSPISLLLIDMTGCDRALPILVLIIVLQKFLLLNPKHIFIVWNTKLNMIHVYWSCLIRKLDFLTVDQLLQYIILISGRKMPKYQKLLFRTSKQSETGYKKSDSSKW